MTEQPADEAPPTNVTPLNTAKPTSAIVSVGPTEAARWLTRNPRNRNLRRSQVTTYARDMSEGRWVYAGESIKFDHNGTLLDGQHRLAAIIESGVTVPMLVVRGLDPDTQNVMDSGIRRQAYDALTLAGHKHSSTLAAAARLAIAWQTGRLTVGGRNPMVSIAEQVAFVEANPDLQRAVEQSMTVKFRFDCPGSVVACAWWALARIDTVEAARFFDDLANMNTAGEGDPKLALLRRLQNARRSRERLPVGSALAMVIRAWNATRTGESLQKMLVTSRNGALEVPVPR